MRKIKKVVLTIPNLRWHKTDCTLWIVTPYNLCLLTAMINNEYDVVIVDANIDNLSVEDFTVAIQREEPDFVGISVLTDEYGEAGHIAARLVKEINREIITVIGGVYATSAYSDIIRDKNIDYIVIGEGEYVLKDLLGFLNGLCDLPKSGIAYRQNGKLVMTGHAPFIKDLDSLPMPAYDKIDYFKYANTIGRLSVDSPRELPYARMFTSRGCPIGCIFCQVEKISGRMFRSRSPENVLKEMEWLKDRYGTKAVIFDDDNFFVNKRRAREIFNGMIRRRLLLKWNAIAVPVFLLDEEILEIMRESGCQFVDLAIESGVQRVLDEIIKKPVKLDKAKRIIKKAKALSIDVATNFVIGFPGETWKEIRQTLRFAEMIDVDYVKIFIANPLPETKLYNMAKEGGYLVNSPLMSWRYGRIKTDEFTPQDLTILRAYEWDRINFSSSEKKKKITAMMNISEEELDQIRQQTRWSLRFS
ncbi:B12-binding domain-containing radical SAM protein [bacterium]|nr:B12-binding domain-containing radical SAM protein [bacterium]MBU1152834.1 B12-binding domain-containing radical SAM protein [bacterium]